MEGKPAQPEHSHRDKLHRKIVRHYNTPNQAHELTWSCYLRKPLLSVQGVAEIVLGSISRAVLRHNYSVFAYVLMPEHVHLLVCPKRAEYSIAQLLFAIKKPAAFRAKKLLAQNDFALLTELTIQDKPSKVSFRLWQEGPGYDRNIRTAETLYCIADYIHLNPVRRGLCKDPIQWPWSSYAQWDRHEVCDISEPHVPIDVDRLPIQIVRK